MSSSTHQHGRRGGRRSSPLAGVAAATLLLITLAGVAATPMTLASHVTIPATFFTVWDQQGANDVPAQSDLSQMGRDESSATNYKLFWSWDSTDQWTGSGQTGDACALFDLNGDAIKRIDAVVCGQVKNPGADTTRVVQNHAPYVFRCDNSKVDRCGQPSSAISYNVGAAKDILAGALNAPQELEVGDGPQAQNLMTDTDPFSAGSNHPDDATLEVSISRSFISGAVSGSHGNKWPAIASPTPTLVNVCSYPSAGNGGNNNPFDCIVAPGSGFLKIEKSATADRTWTFTGTGIGTGSTTHTVATSGGTGSTANIGVVAGTGKTLTESTTTGWTLSAAACSYPTGTSTTASTGSWTSGSYVVSAIEIKVGLLTTCSFTNTRDTGSIVVKKVDQDEAALDGAAFEVRLDGTTDAGTSMTDYGNGLFCIDGLPTGGTYDILETAEPAGYSGDDSIDDVAVAATASTCASRIPADRADDSGVTADRVVTNTRDKGSILILKQDPNGAALNGAAFTAQLIVPEGVTRPSAVTVTDRGAGVFCLDDLPTLKSYDIVESTVPNGYSQTTTPDDIDVTEPSTCSARLEELTEALGDENADPGALADLVITNSPVNADLTIEKTDDRDLPLEGAEFTLYVDEDEDGLWGGDEGEAAEVDVVDGPLTTDDEGVLTFENVAPGFYCVIETDTPAGHTTAAPQCVEVGLGSAAGQGDDQTLEFENVRAHRVVVLVCHEGTDTLDPRDVTLGSDTRTSLAAGTLDAAQEKALCDLGGASFGGIEHSDDELQLGVDVSSH